MNEYYKIVSHLPLPTLEQTRAFVDHVARAHSWYKHLPVFPPGYVFAFYLDPNSGRSRSMVGGVNEFRSVFDSSFKGMARFKVIIKDICDSSQFDPHNRMLTSDYRKRFGHWQYHERRADSWGGAKFCIESIETVDIEPGSSKPFQVPLPVKMPDEVVQRCSCRLNAFVHGNSNFRFSLAGLRAMLTEFDRYVEQHPDSTQIQRFKKIREALRPASNFNLRPDAICDVFISRESAKVLAIEYLILPQGGLANGGCDHYECDLVGVACEEYDFQREQMLETLIRSREIFAKVCQKAA